MSHRNRSVWRECPGYDEKQKVNREDGSYAEAAAKTFVHNHHLPVSRSLVVTPMNGSLATYR
jgi:hypothetical protein